MTHTKTHVFVFIIACATIGTHVPIVALFLISVPIVALVWVGEVWIKSFRLM